MAANPIFETWAKSYSGCDGGDIGSPERRAIWLCGIEWGGARTAEDLQAEMQRDESRPREGYDHASHNLAYIDWCKKHRFPQMRQWAATAQPKLILCLGKNYRGDFKQAFHDDNVTFNYDDPPIDGLDLWWSVNSDGTLVVIIPFMVNRNGLTRNSSIQKFGDRIAQLMEQHGCR